MKNDTTEFASVEAVGGSGRIDLYADIHKALRAWMGHVLTRLGQADAQDHADCSEAVSEMNQLLEVMQMHLETENGIVHPAIEARRPGTIQGIMEDHTSIGQHSPQEMARVLHWILPAITPASRVAMLSGMRASAPAPVFDGVVVAKQRLQPSDWRKLAKQLHLAPAQAALSAG